jgi:hypothetical protein
MAHTNARAVVDPGEGLIRFAGHGPAYSRCPGCGDRYAAIICPICKIPIDASFARAADDAIAIENDARYPYLFYI